MPSKRKSSFADVFPVALFICCWIWTILLTIYFAGNILDADASSNLVLSHFLAEENAVLSTGWRYYTELFAFNLPLVYSFFFRLFDNWMLVRILGAVTLQLIMLLSYLFLYRQTGLSKRGFFYSAAILLTPVSVAYTRIVLCHCHYTFHISLMFFLLALFLKIVASTQLRGNMPLHTKQRDRKLLLLLCVYLTFCVVASLNGIRQLLITSAPSALIALYLLLRSKSFRLAANAPRQTNGKPLPCLKRLLQTCAESRALLLAILGSFFSVCGVAICMFYLRKIYSFQTFSNTGVCLPGLTNLNVLVNFLLNLFGFRNGARVFSEEGVCSLLSLVAFLLAMGSSIWYLKRAKDAPRYGKAFGSLLFLGAFVAETAIFLISGFYALHYYTPVLVFLPLLCAALWDEFPHRAIRLPRIVVCLIAAAFLVNGAVTTNFIVRTPANYVTNYDGLSYNNIHLVKQIRPAATFLAENGYTFGYSLYWDSSVVTELTDGQVEIAAVIEPPVDTFSYAHAKPAMWDDDYHTGKTFVLLPRDELETYETWERLQGGLEVYSDEYYIIWEYPSSISFPIHEWA